MYSLLRLIRLAAPQPSALPRLHTSESPCRNSPHLPRTTTNLPPNYSYHEKLDPNLRRALKIISGEVSVEVRARPTEPSGGLGAGPPPEDGGEGVLGPHWDDERTDPLTSVESVQRFDERLAWLAGEIGTANGLKADAQRRKKRFNKKLHALQSEMIRVTKMASTLSIQNDESLGRSMAASEEQLEDSLDQADATIARAMSRLDALRVRQMKICRKRAEFISSQAEEEAEATEPPAEGEQDAEGGTDEGGEGAEGAEGGETNGQDGVGGEEEGGGEEAEHREAATGTDGSRPTKRRNANGRYGISLMS